MADNDDFRLEEEGEDLFAQVGRPSADDDRSRDLKKEQRLRDELHLSTGDGEEQPEEEDSPDRLSPSAVSRNSENEDSGKASSSRIVLLVVLLLVVAGAGGYFYLGMPSKSAGPSRTSPPKQPIAVPPRPQPALAPQTAGPAEAPAAPEETAPAAAGKEQAEKAAVTTPEPAPAEKEVTEEKIVAKPVAGIPPADVSQAPAPETRYVLEAGNFLRPGGLAAAQTSIRKLGFQPEVKTENRPVPMIRLLNGVFPPDQGQARLAELKKLAPGAFLLRRDGKLAVFAGSFSQPENARQAAAELRAAGFRITEEQASAELPVSSIRFGAFSTRKEAEKAAEKARSQGLEVEIAHSR